MNVFGKMNRLIRKLIIAYGRKLSFEHEDANGIKKNECVLLEDEVSRIGFKFGRRHLRST